MSHFLYLYDPGDIMTFSVAELIKEVVLKVYPDTEVLGRGNILGLRVILSERNLHPDDQIVIVFETEEVRKRIESDYLTEERFPEIQFIPVSIKGESIREGIESLEGKLRNHPHQSSEQNKI